MAEQYVHTLIAVPKDFVPKAEQVQAFFTRLIELGVVPTPIQIKLRTPTEGTQTFINPFTQKPETRRLTKVEELGCIDRIEADVARLANFDLELSGFGNPDTPPLPIEVTSPYHVGVTVRVSSVLRSTTVLHRRTDVSAVKYGESCIAPQPTGYFRNPHNNRIIEVLGAGCARFWIEVQLGKFLFPEIPNGNVEILNRDLVMVATQVFRVPFVQGLGPND